MLLFILVLLCIFFIVHIFYFISILDMLEHIIDVLDLPFSPKDFNYDYLLDNEDEVDYER